MNVYLTQNAFCKSQRLFKITHEFPIYRVMSTQLSHLMATPSLHSLQPIKRQQVMLPNSKGILRPHHLRIETVRHINDIAKAEEKRDYLTHHITATLIPQSTISTTSLGSAPSTSSVYSSAGSVGSQGSFTSQCSDEYVNFFEFVRFLAV